MMLPWWYSCHWRCCYCCWNRYSWAQLITASGFSIFGRTKFCAVSKIFNSIALPSQPHTHTHNFNFPFHSFSSISKLQDLVRVNAISFIHIYDDISFGFHQSNQLIPPPSPHTIQDNKHFNLTMTLAVATNQWKIHGIGRAKKVAHQRVIIKLGHLWMEFSQRKIQKQSARFGWCR